MMIQRTHQIILLIFLVFTISCKDYTNETIHWIDSIPAGTVIDSVKKQQPSFVEIDWNNPIIRDSVKKFTVAKIKNSRDILKMEYSLIFVNDKFEMRRSIK